MMQVADREIWEKYSKEWNITTKEGKKEYELLLFSFAILDRYPLLNEAWNIKKLLGMYKCTWCLRYIW